MFWKTGSDNIKRKYNYSYDHLNRLLQADYSKEGNTTFNSYLEQLTYDKNGNIQSLVRNGNMDTDGMQFENPIDNLTYLYDDTNKNQLLRVFDATSNTQGFKDDTDGTDINHDISEAPDYAYDANGNMTEDKNKGIENIVYNHLNLPVEIVFPTGKITYLYNAVGQKIKKTVTQGDVVSTEYLSGFQYKDAVLQFFPHAEGYVKYTPASGKGSVAKYNYIYNYTDHLGNIRLSYAKDPSDGVLKIIEENHYYPFGLKHSNYNSDQLILEKNEEEILKFIPINPLLTATYKYKYNGKELQDEFGLNMYDYGARNYDPALGRWMNIDPLAELSRRWSPYTYAMNCPTYFIDPDGMLSQSFIDEMWQKSGDDTTWTNNNDGTFSASNGESADTGEKEKEKEKEKTINSKTVDGARVKRKGNGENINYFDPNDKVHIGLYLTAENQNVENGVLKLFFHASNQSINGFQYSQDLDDFLYRDSEVWRNFVDKGGKLTVILYGCLTAEDIKDDSRNPIAKDFAIYNYSKGRNLVLIAATSNISGDYDRKRFFVHNGGHWVKYVKEIVNNSTTKKQ